MKISETIDYDISYNSLFRDIKAILHLNGTYNDVKEWWFGKADEDFMNLVRHFYIADLLVESHKIDVHAIKNKPKT